jgi:hypothetical protein
MRITYTFINPRPELLAGMNDDLPAKVGHSIWGHDLEGGQGDMRAFIDLSLNYAPHEIIWRVTFCSAGGPHFLQPVVNQVGLHLGLVEHDNGDILMVRTHLYVILSVCMNILAKIIWFGLGGFLLVHKGFSIAGRILFSADMVFEKKTVCLHVVIPEMQSFSMRPAKYISHCLNSLIQKLSLFIVRTL